jgi:ubiquinone/menaquinone biosynthesis C-methylase UbiE
LYGGGITIPEQSKEKYWSKYAHIYDEYAEYVVGKNLRHIILTKLSEERDLGEVVEFGCGTGYFTRAIAKNAKHVFATDLSDEMLEVSRVHLGEVHNVTIQKANCESTSYPSGRFETIVMANVLHIIEDPLKALQESWRILKDGGLLIAVSYTDYGLSWFDKIELGIRYFITFGMPPRYGIKNYSPDELKNLVKSAAFSIEEVRLIGDKPKALYLKGRKIMKQP